MDSASLKWSRKSATGEKKMINNILHKTFASLDFLATITKLVFFFRIDVIVRRNEYATKAKSVVFSCPGQLNR